MTNKHCAKRGRKQAIKLKGEPSSEPNAKRQVAFLSIFTVKNVILSELLCLYISSAGLRLYPYTVLRCPKLEFKFLTRILYMY